MKKLKETLKDIRKTFGEFGLDLCLTRFNERDISDLDLLVKKDQYKDVINIFEKLGYRPSSHDYAWGGRKKDYQKNLTRKDRVKIDLHKDFTWRRKKYLDLKFIWGNLKTEKIEEVDVNVPNFQIDSFLVVINIIFEKTYITFKDFSFVKNFLKIKNRKPFLNQAEKYGWRKSLEKFLSWVSNIDFDKNETIFLPVWLIIYSYVQKFDLVSFVYYLFFRTRYLVNKKLPYE